MPETNWPLGARSAISLRPLFDSTTSTGSKGKPRSFVGAALSSAYICLSHAWARSCGDRTGNKCDFSSQPSDVHDGRSLVFPGFAEVFTALASGVGNTTFREIRIGYGCATHPCLSRVSFRPTRCFASPARPTRRSAGVLQTCLAKLPAPAGRLAEREALLRRTP